MHRTFRVPQIVFWSLVLGMTLGSTATGQQVAPPPAAKEDQSAPRGNALIVPINGSQRLQMSSKRPNGESRKIERVLNPKENVARVTPLDPTSVLVTGLEAGVTRITLFGEGNVQESIDIIVQFDVEYLRTLLVRVIPTASVQPVPGANGAVILSGTVARAEDVDIIMRTAITVVGSADRVINAMRVGGVMQVQLDTVVARVNRSAMRTMGFNFILTYPPTTFQSLVGNVATGATSTSISSPANLTLVTSNFMGFLLALRDEKLAKLLTEPRLVTLSGQPATLHSGGQQAIPQPQGLGTVGVTFQDFGTDLTFVPIVLGNGRIHLDIRTSVSQLDQASGTVIQGTQVPGRLDQVARTVLEIEDGQTLAIGGLIQHRTDAVATKVPVLGDLPYIGAAFSFKSYTDIEEELVILVTPHVVDPMACNQLPKCLPGQETRKPDDFELFLEGILEAPRGSREVWHDRRYVPAYKNGPTSTLFPCAGAAGAAGPGCKAGGPAVDSCPRPGTLPTGNPEANPAPPGGAMPPAGPGEAATSFLGTGSSSETTPAETSKPTALPGSLPSTGSTDAKK